MVWEQRSQTIVMLTDLAESGATKCHQYWPNVNDSAQYNNRFLVSCIRSEEDKSNPVVTIREFSLIDVVSQSELDVVQLQYRGWPDFGAPKKPQAFLDFIQLVHSSAPDSKGNVGPIVTHCSAGKLPSSSQVLFGLTHFYFRHWTYRSLRVSGDADSHDRSRFAH